MWILGVIMFIPDYAIVTPHCNVLYIHTVLPLEESGCELPQMDNECRPKNKNGPLVFMFKPYVIIHNMLIVFLFRRAGEWMYDIS